MTLASGPSGAAPPRGRSARRPRLVHVVADALGDVDATRLPLDIPGVAAARALRERLSAQLATHLLPRLKELDHPALVVFGGPTGAGKSTLVSSLVGTEVSEAGVLRPTTHRPILAVNPADRQAMAGHPLLDQADVVVHPAVPAGLALLDTPDLDSVDDANRARGAQLVEAADLWVFVTTAGRYGDALPWATLQAAHARGVTVAVVLNRVPDGALVDVRSDLHNRLVASGLEGAPLFVLPDLGPHEGLLPPGAVEDLSDWLDLLASRSHGATVVARTIRGTWPSLREDLLELADAVDAQVGAAEQLADMARDVADAEATRLGADLGAGAVARGGLATRWLAVTTSGGALRQLASGAGRLRSRGRAARRRSDAAAALRDTLVAAVLGVVVDAAGHTRRRIGSAWLAPGLGGAALVEEIDVAEAGRACAHRARDAVDGWTDRVAADLTARMPGPSRREAGLLDLQGWASIACAAAAGVDGAVRAVDTGLGEHGPATREVARAALVDAARGVVRAEAETFVRLVDALGLDETAALGLRLRASELKGVV